VSIEMHKEEEEEEDKPLKRMRHSRRMRLIVLVPTCKILGTCFI